LKKLLKTRTNEYEELKCVVLEKNKNILSLTDENKDWRSKVEFFYLELRKSKEEKRNQVAYEEAAFQREQELTTRAETAEKQSKNLIQLLETKSNELDALKKKEKQLLMLDKMEEANQNLRKELEEAHEA